MLRTFPRNKCGRFIHKIALRILSHKQVLRTPQGNGYEYTERWSCVGLQPVSRPWGTIAAHTPLRILRDMYWGERLCTYPRRIQLPSSGIYYGITMIDHLLLICLRKNKCINQPTLIESCQWHHGYRRAVWRKVSIFAGTRYVLGAGSSGTRERERDAEEAKMEIKINISSGHAQRLMTLHKDPEWERAFVASPARVQLLL